MQPEVLLPLALLFIAHGLPSNAQGEGEAAASAAPPASSAAGAGPTYYDVGRPFSLTCPDRANPADAYVWTVNGTALAVSSLKDRFKLDKEGAVLRVEGRTQEDDFGTYACSAGAATTQWDVRGRPHAKLQPNTNVVEGQKLKLVCKLVGKPYPGVAWTFSNASSNSTPLAAALGARARLGASEQGVAGAELQLEQAQRADAGFLTCAPAQGLPATTQLRVKDMYAALWPFLGICAEVFVLCAIILVYEKRRTKPELDDSDTDNHDQ